MVCKLQSTLHITAMALESKVDQSMSYSGMFFDRGDLCCVE